MDRDTEFILLEQSVRNCTACSLRSNVQHPLFAQGTNKPKITVIGPGPTVWEQKNGVAWSGKVGNYTRRLLHDAGINTREVAWMHIVCCGDNPKQSEIDACRLNARRQLAALSAPYTLVVGAVATQALLSFQVSLKDLRGQWWKPPSGGWAMTVNHPSASMHGYAAGQEAVLKRDLDKFAKSIIFGDLNPPKLSESCIKCSRWASHFKNGVAFCSKHLPTVTKRTKSYTQLSLLGELVEE